MGVQRTGVRSKGSLRREENLRRLRVMTSSNLTSRAYFARFHTSTAAGPPTDGAVLVYLSSSPARVKFVRFCSVPFQFGNELYSTRRFRSDPLTEYVPKYAMLPPPIAAYSSAVPFVRLFDAYLGRSGRINIRE